MHSTVDHRFPTAAQLCASAAAIRKYDKIPDAAAAATAAGAAAGVSALQCFAFALLVPVRCIQYQNFMRNYDKSKYIANSCSGARWRAIAGQHLQGVVSPCAEAFSSAFKAKQQAAMHLCRYIVKHVADSRAYQDNARFCAILSLLCQSFGGNL